VGSAVQAARIVRRELPVYPPLARTARISGVVRLQAIIAVDGSIAELNVVSGHPLLIAAAIDAVQQWVYKPTVLNGSRCPWILWVRELHARPLDRANALSADPCPRRIA
jgi:TonB family protein